MKVHTKFYDEGHEARMEGQSHSDNPYAPSSDEGFEWMCGWSDADLVAAPEGAL